jgi:hypothetical protein
VLSLDCSLPVTGSNTPAVLIAATAALLVGMALLRVGKRRAAATIALVCLVATSLAVSQHRADAQTETCMPATTLPVAGNTVSGTYRKTGALGGDGLVDGALMTLVEPGADGLLDTPDDTQRTTTTASDGTYSFDHVQPGPHRVVTSALPTVAEDFTVEARRNTTNDFQGRWGALSPAGATATITVAGLDQMFGTADDQVVTAVTGPNGDFAVSIPGPAVVGPFTIVATSIPGHVAVSIAGVLGTNFFGTQTVSAWALAANAIAVIVADGTDQTNVDFRATTTDSGFTQPVSA